jgi:DNA-binding GntR family transcriptional regulator
MEPIDILSKIALSPRGALRHAMMKQLLHAIFEGKIPPGTRLMVMKLAERFGTSSTPVREALVELAGMGVVDFFHNRGAIVAPFGPNELREIYQLRRVLESEAARFGTGRISRELLEGLRQEMLPLLDSAENLADWCRRATAADLRLHEAIASHCGSARLAKEIQRYDIFVQTIREILGQDRLAQRQAVEEHVAILDSMLAGDADHAAAAMSRHVDSAAAVCEAAMFKP